MPLEMFNIDTTLTDKFREPLLQRFPANCSFEVYSRLFRILNLPVLEQVNLGITGRLAYEINNK